jgi:hypothetical protein
MVLNSSFCAEYDVQSICTQYPIFEIICNPGKRYGPKYRVQKIGSEYRFYTINQKKTVQLFNVLTLKNSQVNLKK